MAVYLDEKEEERRRQELEEFSRERQEAIDTERTNSKDRRMKQDRIIQKILFLTAAAVLIYLVVVWARGL